MIIFCQEKKRKERELLPFVQDLSMSGTPTSAVARSDGRRFIYGLMIGTLTGAFVKIFAAPRWNHFPQGGASAPVPPL